MRTRQAESGFLRHLGACRDSRRQRTAFRINLHQVGWVVPELAAALAGFPQIRAEPNLVTLIAPEALQPIAHALAGLGFHRWRGEAFDVRAEPDGPVLAELDRGALPSFGVRAIGVHVNGLVRRRDGIWLWVARRSPHKQLDPGKLDHIVAGGVPAGLTPWQTLLKEAAEEAAIPADLARQARLAGQIAYAMERPEGLRRDLLFNYDLELPENFQPQPMDGEVDGFELWPLPRALEAVRETDQFKFNVNLVLIDLFLRQDLIEDDLAHRLRAALDSGEV
jgi:8-oxo-dGTP pyrophosphatase MutT (NUDIX family)